MSKELKVGDVVILNSGGPELTVESLSDCNGMACCVWFNHRVSPNGSDGELLQEEIAVAALRHARSVSCEHRFVIVRTPAGGFTERQGHAQYELLFACILCGDAEFKVTLDRATAEELELELPRGRR